MGESAKASKRVNREGFEQQCIADRLGGENGLDVFGNSKGLPLQTREGGGGASVKADWAHRVRGVGAGMRS